MSDRAADIPEVTYEAGFILWAATTSDQETIDGANKYTAFNGITPEDAKLIRTPKGGIDVILKRAFTFNKKNEESSNMSDTEPYTQTWPAGTILWVAGDEPHYIEEAKAWVKEKALTGDDVKLVKHAGLRVEVVAKREVRI